jgi:arabinogalactan oligomer/maltooligosaccharide transport system permease protein
LAETAQNTEKGSSPEENPYSFKNAIKNGNALTRLSCLIMGLGNIAHKQVIKGLVFLLCEIGYFWFLFKPYGGEYWISKLPSLGDAKQVKVWNEAKGVFEYTAGDNSQLILLYAIAALFVTVVFIFAWMMTVKSAYQVQCQTASGEHVNSFAEDIKTLFDRNIHALLMFLPVAFLMVFTVLPLIYMMSMAFTNYSKSGNHLILFKWVGFKNFINVLSFKSNIGQQFWGVLIWTLVWAFFATFLNFFLGTLVAMLINRPRTKCKGLWRFCFTLSIAVPQFVSLLIMHTMLQPEGIVNRMLKNAGLISTSLPFFSNATWARVTVIVIDLWVGIPYTLMQVTGILKNIPADLYEAAKVDGANSIQMFFKITLPYMLFVMTPYLITTFTGNINNFNVIYLLSGGAPVPVGSSAGKTDLLVTWLYKLSVDQQNYCIAAVIGIMTFVVLGVVSLVAYHNSGSYKNEEGFR